MNQFSAAAVEEVGRSGAPQGRSARRACPRAAAGRLDGRAGGVAIGAEDAAVTGLGPQQPSAPLALVEDLAGVRGHALAFPMPAVGAGEGRPEAAHAARLRFHKALAARGARSLDSFMTAHLSRPCRERTRVAATGPRPFGRWRSPPRNTARALSCLERQPKSSARSRSAAVG